MRKSLSDNPSYVVGKRRLLFDQTQIIEVNLQDRAAVSAVFFWLCCSRWKESAAVRIRANPDQAVRRYIELPYLVLVLLLVAISGVFI